MSGRIRRIAARRIRRSVSGGAVTTAVDGSVVGVCALSEWASRTTHSKVLPAMLGMITEGGSVRVVWLSRGHLWSCGFSVGITEVASATVSTKMRSLSRDPAWREFKRTQAGRFAGKAHDKTSRYVPQWVRISVTQRDGGRCVYCGESDPRKLELDHRLAYSKGGASDNPDNICLGCMKCNRSKSDSDWGWG
jgi:hypothetical protein